ncbi:T9SS type A sorting domain-containing protein [candidate division KSB1 bacterium]|nr:T9SS type A sorting domain-containing protein [candidate division KSB1 bacterium]
MRHLLSILFITLLLASMAWGQEPQSVGPTHVTYPTKIDISKPLRDLARPFEEWESGTLDREVRNHPPHDFPQCPEGLDGALQTAPATRTLGPPTLNFEGVNNNCGCLPPDTNMDVGPNHIIQTVNIHFDIFDKSGNSLMGVTPMNSLWSGFGGGCEFGNDGDPTVNYDEAADRWIIEQFDFATAQCIAVSMTPDPLGAYFRYAFPTPGNDYPKTGVMTTCYTGTIRNFSVPFSMDAVAWQRDSMLVGNNAAMLTFSMTQLLPGIDGFLPSDLDGPTAAPAGRDATYLGHQDGPNRLAIFELTNVNWAVPTGTFTGPTFLPVNAYSTIFPGVPQPNTNQNLDDFAGFSLYRLAYRNFGGHESMVTTNSVDVNDFPDHAGIRWYELRDTGGGWAVRQQGTYSPDSDHRWMPSIAMNGNGDIMVGYSVSSNKTFPSIRYTGRLAGDPLNQMTFAEGLIVAGSGSQTHPAGRWGDYAAMQIDPSDDNTFYFTTEYIATTGSSPWQTRIASFAPNNGAPLVDITVTPSVPVPVIIPAGGLTLDMVVTVDNNGSSTLNAQVWNTVSIEGNEVGPVGGLGVTNINVPAGGQFSTTFSNFEFPAGLRPDSFIFNWKVGTFPNVQLDRALFVFIKSAGPTFTKAGGDDWGLGPVQEVEVPEAFTLEQNYPNPFNPSTQIRYGLDKQTHVKLSIYNTLGQEVVTLVDGVQDAGFQTVSWNGTDNLGQQVSAGVYVYRLEAGNNVQIKKMTFTK